MSKRIFALFTAVLILLLCGCSENKQSEKPAEASEVELRFYSTLGGASDSGITAEVLSDFTSKYSYITLFYSSVAADEAYKLSLPDSATYRTKAPDIVYGPLYAVSDLLGEEYVSIDEIRTYSPDYASEIDDFALLRDSSGLPYGVPVRGEGKVLVVNTELSGGSIDPGETAEKISDSDIFLFADNALDSELFFVYLMTLRTNSQIDPKAPEAHWIDGFELFSSLVRSGAFAPSDTNPYELFTDNKAVFAVLSESEAASLKGESYRCAAFFGGFSEGFFITRSAMSDPLKRKAAIELAEMLIAEDSRYGEGKVPADGSGVFFSLREAYSLTPCAEGSWDEVLKSLTKGDDPKQVLQNYMNSAVSASDA